jgi:hypothetical protein
VRLESCLAAHCRKWLDAHLKDQWYLGKPVVIEEFGKAVGAQLFLASIILFTIALQSLTVKGVTACCQSIEQQ